jgi:LysM repeat protein
MYKPLTVISLIAGLALVACGDESRQQSASVPSTPPAFEEMTIEIDVTELASVSDEETADSPPAEFVDIADLTELAPEEPPAPVPLASFSLRRGESLAHFARWAELPVEVIAETSGLDLGGSYPVGTELLLPVDDQARGQVEERRQDHRVARVEGYLASRGGADGSEFYSVKTGDTAWSIARHNHGIPVWLLEAYNPSVALDTLRPGQELLVPVIDDVVVSVEEDE